MSTPKPKAMKPMKPRPRVFKGYVNRIDFEEEPAFKVSNAMDLSEDRMWNYPVLILDASEAGRA